MEEFEAFGRGYIGYCGRYELDEEHGTVTYLPLVAFLPNLIGQRLLRQVSVTGNLLGSKWLRSAHHLDGRLALLEPA